MAFVNTSGAFVQRNSSTRAICARRTRSIAPRAALTPLADRILVKVDEASEESQGGLYLGKSEQAQQKTGTVVAVAPGRYSPEGEKETIDVAVGDHVMWKDDFGSEKIDPGLTEGQGELLALKIYSVVAKW